MKIKLIIFTSLSKRHKYFCNQLSQNFQILGIVNEKKKSNDIMVEQDKDISEHFNYLKIKEDYYFGDYHNFPLPEESILTLEHGQSSDIGVFEWVKEKKPDYIILFGSSIIKDPILSYFNGKIINMHLGLSPYYRGSGTNFWPLVNSEPECVGATIHLAVLKVDAGGILAQIRPEDIRPDDTSYDIGCKAIIAGTKKMCECIEKYHNKEIYPIEQDLSVGRVYKRRDFNINALKTMQANFDCGMLTEYLKNKFVRDSKFPIIEI